MDFFFQFLSDPIGFISTGLYNLLTGWGVPGALVSFGLLVLGAGILAAAGLMLPLFTIWVERRLIGRMQDRMGPNRVGPFGLLQSVADTIKLLVKEDFTPAGADRVMFFLAPVLSVASILGLWAVLPFANKIVGVDLNVGALYLIAVGSLGTLSIMLAGWSSNNKYALLGGFRAVSQLVAYEVPMLISLLVPVLLARSLSLQTIVAAQGGAWFILAAPIPALIYFLASVAELSRAPFDLLEADSEIVSGFNIEYSAMKFGMFFVAEFTHAFTIGALMAVLFFGGWRGPWAEQYPLLGLLYLSLKAFSGYFIIILLRAALPRLRIDQLLNFSWKFLTPLALAALVGVAVADKLIPAGWSALAWGPWARGGLLLGVNLLLAAGTLLALKLTRARI